MYKLTVLNSRPVAYYSLQEANTYHPIRYGADGATYNDFINSDRPAGLSFGRALNTTESKSFGIEFWMLPLQNNDNKLVVGNGDTEVRLLRKDTVVFKCGSVLLTAPIENKSSHFMFQFNGERLFIYVDGNEVASASFGGSFNSSSGFALNAPNNSHAISDMAFYNYFLDQQTINSHYLSGVDLRPEPVYSYLEHVNFSNPEFSVLDSITWPAASGEDYNNMRESAGTLTALEPTLWRAFYLIDEDTTSLSIKVDSDAPVRYSFDEVNWVSVVEGALPVNNETGIFLDSAMDTGQVLRSVRLTLYSNTAVGIASRSDIVSFGSVFSNEVHPPTQHYYQDGITTAEPIVINFSSTPSAILSFMYYLESSSTARVSTDITLTNGVLSAPANTVVNGGRGVLPGWNLFDVPLVSAGSFVIEPGKLRYLSVSPNTVNQYRRLFLPYKIVINDQGPVITTQNKPNLYSIPWSKV